MRQTSWKRDSIGAKPVHLNQTIDPDPIGPVPSLIVFEDQMEDLGGSNVYRRKKNHLKQVTD